MSYVATPFYGGSKGDNGMSLAAATALGAGLSFIGGLASNAINNSIANRNLRYQREANEQNIALQREINSQNIAFQQKENDITREREDNAVQRAAADMQAAGLSKTLAAGNPASAAALTAPSANAPKVNALNNGFKYESALQKMNIASLMLDMASKQQQLEINKGIADAQIANLGSQTAHQNLVNDTFMEQFGMEKSFKSAQTRYYDAQAAGQEAQNVLIEKYGAQKAVEEINVLAAQRASYNAQALLTTMNCEKVAEEIAKIVAETYNLGLQGEKLAEEVAYAELQNQALQHNIDVAEKYDYPVGVYPSGLVNYIDRTGRAGTDNNVFRGIYNFGFPSLIKEVTGPKTISNPGKSKKLIDFFDFMRFFH